MEIRFLQPGDLGDVLAVLESWDSESPKLFSWNSQSLTEEFYASIALGGSLGLWMNGELAAFILFRDLPGACEIQFLATSKVNCGKGVMKNLLRELQKRCEKQQLSIWLEVHAKNYSACGLYRSMGFVQTGLRRGYYSDGGDAFLMELSPRVIRS